MRTLPKITVVTPSYNQGAFLEGTIRSVLDQGYPRLEYSIIDGGSTDDSVSIIKRYENRLAYWVSEKDRGQGHAINKGISRATGDILGWLNSDDMLEPGALHTVAEHAIRFPDAGAFVGHGRIIDVTGKEIYYRKPGELTFEGLCQWLEGGDFLQPSCFFTRDAWEATGQLDESIHIALDVDLWLRMVKKVEFRIIDKLLSTSLSHPNAKTTAFRNHMVLDCAMVIARTGGDRFVRDLLSDVAGRLSYYEANFKKIMTHPVVRFLTLVGRLLIKPAVRWQDASLNSGRERKHYPDN